MLILKDNVKPAQQGFVNVFHTLWQDPDALLSIVDQSHKIILSNTTFQNLIASDTLDETKLPKEISKRLSFHVTKAFESQSVVSYSDYLKTENPTQHFAIFCFPIKELNDITSVGVIAVDAERFQWLTTPLLEETKRSLTQAQKTIESLQKEIEEAQRLATYDPLTKVYNRAQVESTIKKEIAKFQRLKQDSSIIFIDLDNFKRINDTYGHNVGDSVLVQLCRVTENTLRPFDMIARWGGEEFIVILPNTNFQNAHLVATRLCQLIANTAFDKVEKVTASFGVATYQADEPWNIWIDRADSAMYLAKKNGKNRVEPQNEHDVVKPKIEQSSSFLHLVWNKSFECGHPTIDAQHQELFVHANALFTAFLNGESKSNILALINTLLSAVGVHFSDEIKILRSIHYPDVDAHEEIHKEIVRKAISAVQRYEHGQLQLGELFSFLAYDVVDIHMLKDDQKFFSFVKANKNNA